MAHPRKVVVLFPVAIIVLLALAARFGTPPVDAAQLDGTFAAIPIVSNINNYDGNAITDPQAPSRVSHVPVNVNILAKDSEPAMSPQKFTKTVVEQNGTTEIVTVTPLGVSHSGNDAEVATSSLALTAVFLAATSVFILS